MASMDRTADRQTFIAGIAAGAVLVLVGVVAYVATDFASITALIPAFFGIAFVALGRLGLNAGRRDIGVYGLGLLAVLGIAGSAMGIADIITMLTGGTVTSPIATLSQALMITACIIVLVLVARSILSQR